MAYVKGHRMAPSLLAWMDARKRFGHGESVILSQARAVSALAHGLGLVSPGELPADAVARHFHNREHSPETAHRYQKALDKWFEWATHGDLWASQSTGTEKNLTDPDLIRWKTVLKARGKSPNTITAYTTDVQNMVDYAGYPARELNDEDFDLYTGMVRERIEERGRMMSNIYYNRLLNSAKQFRKWAKLEPFGPDIKPLPRGDQYRDPISTENLERLIRIAHEEAEAGDAMARTMRAMLILMSTTGLRPHEVIKITPLHLHEERGRTYIRLTVAKGRRGQKITPLLASDAAVAELNQHWDPHEAIAPADWDAKKAGRYFTGWCRSHGVKTHPYELRRFFASWLYEESGHNLLLVKQQMRHSSVAITERYCQLVQEERHTLTVQQFGAHLLPQQMQDNVVRLRHA